MHNQSLSCPPGSGIPSLGRGKGIAFSSAAAIVAVTAFADNFSGESNGTLGGQNGWLDATPGTDAKPTVSGGVVQVGDNTTATAVQNGIGVVQGDMTISGDVLVDDYPSVVFVFAYSKTSKAWLGGNTFSRGISILYFDGTNFNTLKSVSQGQLNNSGSLTRITQAMTVRGNTISITAGGSGINGVTTNFTLTDSGQIALLQGGGYVGFASGPLGAGSGRARNLLGFNFSKP